MVIYEEIACFQDRQWLECFAIICGRDNLKNEANLEVTKTAVALGTI